MSVSQLPQVLGRYRVLGELATGGMAEILLARLEGPSGFSRPVVIKRILPHLARQKEFQAMFLDEGRIVAGIRHPNVVQVHELSNEHEELFLVMEYLEGEPVSGLMKRLKASDAELDPRLAAYIVAEVCAGLHAAHELEDDAGVRQNLVHRDVSPQNVIVTYDGHVKLLDFGVALAAGRVTRTEVGQLKGKLQYMSPEQCTGAALDHRSDIFALGVVLYELCTGRLLFKRDSSAATVRAICDEPVLPPSRLVPQLPRALESVILRALEPLPTHRHDSCATMRAALLDALREMGDGGDEETKLSALMRERFADRVAEKRELLRRVKVGSDLGVIPPGEVDSSVELPTVAQGSKRSTFTADVRPPAVTRAPFIVAIALGLALVGLGGYYIAQRSVAAPPPMTSPAVALPAATAPVLLAAPPTLATTPAPSLAEAPPGRDKPHVATAKEKPVHKRPATKHQDKPGDDYQRFE